MTMKGTSFCFGVVLMSDTADYFRHRHRRPLRCHKTMAQQVMAKGLRSRILANLAPRDVKNVRLASGNASSN